LTFCHNLTFCIIGRTTHNRKAKVPWTDILDNPDKYLYPECVLNKVRIKDPSKMQSETINTLYAFLLHRQLMNKTVFKFRSVDNNDNIAGPLTDMLQSLFDKELLALSDNELSSEEEMLEMLRKRTVKDE
jgi:hypothetical protein